ncbi:MAG: hypothetical protein R2734_20135 [Nocardioides sp.]
MLKVESNDAIRGRISVPSSQCGRAGLASTGSSRPAPGWSPTLLSVYASFQYHSSMPGW